MADTSLPPFLHQFFWEYDPVNIDTVRHASLIMGRIMERGSWAAMCWLKQRYSHAELAAFLRTRGVRILPPRELNYWSLICGIPAQTRKQWIKKTRTKDPIWAGRNASPPLLRPLIVWPEYNLPLADIPDIACMKLSAITNRGSRKDFIDLFVITRDHLTLKECLSLFTLKFRARDIGHVLRSLVFFEDADAEPEVNTHLSISWTKIKKTFETEVKNL